MSRQLPPMLTQQFTLEFNDQGYRKKVPCTLAIDMCSIRRVLGRKAARNDGKRARDGHVVVTLCRNVETIGPETPEIGTVCYE